MDTASRATGRLMAGIQHPRGLLMHYLLVVAMVLGLLAAGAVLDRTNVNRVMMDDEAIILLSHQMHLSQQIYVLAAQIHTPEDRPDPSEVAGLVSELDQTHRDVMAIALSIPHGNSEARALAASVNEFVALARRVLEMPRGAPGAAAALDDLTAMAVASLPERLEAQAEVFREDAQRSRYAIGRHDVLIFALVASILLLEAAFVFWPAYRKAITSLDRLTSTNSAIAEQNRQLEESARELADSAHVDPLTGLTNRKRLNEFLEEALADLNPETQVCVLHVDLDHFKELNDTFGHAAGDAALKQVAELMLSEVRSSDIVARIGGDEFVIAMVLDKATTESIVQDICDRLIAKISEPMVLNGADTRLGASIGFAFAEDGIGDPEALIARADVALYEVKRAGKGAARVFTFEMQARVAERNAIALDMERALDAGEFVPFFQPVVSLDSGTVLGLEMLARWAHPDRGLLSPDDFMDVAEEAGLIDAVEARVLLDGLDGLASLRQQGFTIPPLSLNASTRSMRYDDFAERLTDAVRAREFRPDQIVVEVLENTLFDVARDQSAATVAKLRALGYMVCVSRFGTGYASLPVLRDLDVTSLKIDRSLVSRITKDPERKIVSAIVGLAQAMALGVIADGIDTERHVGNLRDIGAEAGQGSAIARPMGLDALRSWLEDHGLAEDLEAARA